MSPHSLLRFTRHASVCVLAGLYEVTTETGMPHLEENLRYSIKHEKRCLAEKDLATAFPVLAHPSLASCHLNAESRTNSRITYALTCSEGHGTTGQAVWDLREHDITGTLFVKLGGKNMTFYQRLIAKPVRNLGSDDRPCS